MDQVCLILHQYIYDSKKLIFLAFTTTFSDPAGNGIWSVSMSSNGAYQLAGSNGDIFFQSSTYRTSKCF